MSRDRTTQYSLNHTHSASTAINNQFSLAQVRTIPSFICSPWNTYELFLELNPHVALVLCKEGREVRVMKIFGDAADCDATLDKYPFPLIGIQHPNFVKWLPP